MHKKKDKHYVFPNFSRRKKAIRYADTGIAIPEEIKQKRQEARLEISNLREKINLI